jgi:hypothetical protein
MAKPRGVHTGQGRPGFPLTFERNLNPIFYTYVGRKLRRRAEADARIIAPRIMENMSKQVDFADDRARIAVQAAVEIVETKLDNGVHVYSAKDRMAAINTILNFTQPKPASKTELTVQTAESWLESLAGADEAE